MPEFPYPPDVNSDLRALFRLDRQDRAGRDLGASSITRGEGSLDLYDTDNGPVVGRYGDLPDGSFGVGVEHRGTFWNVSALVGGIQDHDAAQDTQITNAWVRADAARNRADAAHDRLDGHDSTLASHDTRITNAWARGNAAGNRADAAQARADAAHDRLDGHASRLGNAENRLDSHVSRIGAAEGTLSSHDTRITNAQVRANSARDRADAAYALASSAPSSQAVQTLISRQAQIIAWIIQSRQNVPELPPWPGN